MTKKVDANPVDLIKQAIDIATNQIWEEGYVRSADPEALALETLGVLVSKYCEWYGESILRVAIAALEDANFRPEVAELTKILARLHQAQ